MFITQTRTTANFLAGEKCEETTLHASVEHGLANHAWTTSNIHSSARGFENKKWLGTDFEREVRNSWSSVPRAFERIWSCTWMCRITFTCGHFLNHGSMVRAQLGDSMVNLYQAWVSLNPPRLVKLFVGLWKIEPKWSISTEPTQSPIIGNWNVFSRRLVGKRFFIVRNLKKVN